MESNFKESFLNIIHDKKYTAIPSKTNYDIMVACIQECAVKKKHNETLSITEVNLTRRYSIRIEQQVPILYHIGDHGKENAQRVVHQDELFTVLDGSHKKLGHAGQNLMWHDLRDFYRGLTNQAKKWHWSSATKTSRNSV